MRIPERSPPWTWPWQRGEGRLGSAGCGPTPGPTPPACTHHVHDARHPHHLEEPVIHAWLLEP